MNNPLSLVTHTRKRYDQELQKTLMEVQVSVGDAPKSWIPIQTFLALLNLKENQNDPQNNTMKEV